MAKLSAHGAELGRIHYTTYTCAHMADGQILRKDGAGGWKIFKRCKAGMDPRAVYENALAHYNAQAQTRPALAAYRTALHDLAGRSKAWKLHLAIELMPDDPDGIWSHVHDDYTDAIPCDVSEIIEICRLFKAAEIETAARAKVSA